MRDFTILHAAEPRLGHREPPDGRRGKDRLQAFERLVDRALQSGADAILVAGALLAAQAPDPELLAAATEFKG